MSTVNGHSGDALAMVSGARPVVLLRYRPGTTRQTARTVHLVPLPLKNEADTAGVALCGALLRLDQVETVTPGEGVPCSLCLISQARAEPLPTPTATTLVDASIDECGPQAAAVTYRTWGWPVTQHRNWIVLAGEPYGVVLAWPSEVHRASGSLPLPPTTTPHGPITWVHPPPSNALQLCREIDVFGAVRTALRDPST